MRALHLFHAPRRRLSFLHSSRTLFSHHRFAEQQSSLAARFRPSPLLPSTSTSAFSTSTRRPAKKKQQEKRDRRITLIRYFLHHPKNRRPLRFSRTRFLRHWTIHRAWQTLCAQQRQQRELELQRQYHSMREACEALRLMGEDGLSVAESSAAAAAATDGNSGDAAGSVKSADGFLRRSDGKGGPPQAPRSEKEAVAAERQKEVGKLYRWAMNKEGVWAGMPIEYARAQTETPPRRGWNHEWTRPARAESS